MPAGRADLTHAPAPPRGATTDGPSLLDSATGPWSTPVEDWRKGLSKSQRAGLLTSITIFRKATSKNLKTLDYRKARKYDRGRTEARRRYAAGWLYGNKKISHIPKAELKKVKKHKSAHKKPKKAPGRWQELASVLWAPVVHVAPTARG